MSSAAVTNLSGRLMWTLVMVGLIAAIYLLMRRGWLRQLASQSTLVEPPAVGTSEPRFKGIYASTTFAGQPLKRVVAHGLGVRSEVHVGISASGIDLFRPAAHSFSIPFSSLIGVSRSSAIAGKVVGDNGLVLLTWRLGEVEVDTGLLVRDEGLISELAERL